MHHRTAPEGYDSNYQAIIQLLRFGPAIWTNTEMLVLIFHAERSTASGKDSDAHSESQAADGIYSAHSLSWIRGPAGVSRATWYRTNASLERDHQVLQIFRRHRKISDYRIAWPAVKQRIEEWKTSNRRTAENSLPVASHRETLTPVLASQRETPGSQPETQEHFSPKDRIPSECQQKLQNLEIDGSATQANYPPLASHRETPHMTLTLDFDSQVQTRKAEVATAIQELTGERIHTDRLLETAAAAAMKTHLPAGAITRFFYDKAEDFRRRGYAFTAGLLTRTIAEELIPWITANQRLLAILQTQEIREAQRSAEPRTMPTNPNAQRDDVDAAKDKTG